MNGAPIYVHQQLECIIIKKYIELGNSISNSLKKFHLNLGAQNETEYGKVPFDGLNRLAAVLSDHVQ